MGRGTDRERRPHGLGDRYGPAGLVAGKVAVRGSQGLLGGLGPDRDGIGVQIGHGGGLLGQNRAAFTGHFGEAAGHEDAVDDACRLGRRR